MLANKTVYMSLVRERTNETIVLEMNKALITIKKYDDKQKFMNMLGQDNFWKKNRLDLWAQLNDDAIDNEVFLAIPEQDRLYISKVPFKHTSQMLNYIKVELSNAIDSKIQKRRRVEPEHWNIDNNNSIYSNGERQYVTRAIRADIPYFYIRTEDVDKFDQEFSKLITKYMVKDPLRLKNGAQRFKVKTVANRYVERYFGFAREREYYW